MSKVKDSISLTINGSKYKIKADQDTPLLFVLRDNMGLCATRYGCGEATCGACTVIIDGQAVMSCDISLGAVAGKSVQTAEGMQAKPSHPLLEAFIKHQAGQCGYCLTGILMASKALLEKEPFATRKRIAEVLDSNLCRCGAHSRILDAVEEAGKFMSKEQ
jgi:aerobic-type carbon monoxide dehydrogenase small subunit (CoxS/CutS family)